MSKSKDRRVSIGEKVIFVSVVGWDSWVQEWNRLLSGDSQFVKQPMEPLLFSDLPDGTILNVDCVLGLLHKLHDKHISGEKVPFLFRLALDPEIRSTEIWTKPIDILTACYLKIAWEAQSTATTLNLLYGHGLNDVLTYFTSKWWYEWCQCIPAAQTHEFFALKNYLISLCDMVWQSDTSRRYPELYARKGKLFTALIHSGDAVLMLTEQYRWESLTEKQMEELRTYIKGEYEGFQPTHGEGSHEPDQYPLGQNCPAARAYVLLKTLLDNKEKKKAK